VQNGGKREENRINGGMDWWKDLLRLVSDYAILNFEIKIAYRSDS
jgi:hypothetical protein